MDEVFNPPRRVGVAFNMTLALLALFGALALLIVGSGSLSREPNWLLLLPAVPLLLLSAFLFYRVFLLFSTHYLLNRATLELQWGFRREIIPLDAIDWAHPVSDFDTPLPLPGFLLPGQYYGTRQIRGLGTVEFAGTEKANMVLIRSGERHFVISPVSARVFSESLERRSEQGAAELVEPTSENLRTMLSGITQDKTVKTIQIINLSALLLLAAAAAALSATRMEITWVTLERVTSNRLLLLVLLGVLTWLINTLLGAYFYLRELLVKRWIYLLWAWSALICLILTIASVFMSLGGG